MLPADPANAEYQEGAAAGRDIAKAAIDCPYMPPDTRRDQWMSGFSAVRREVSAASDPDRLTGGPTRDGGGLPGMHIG